MLKASTVFKVLLTVFVVIAASTVFIEITNVQLNAAMVNQLTAKAIDQSCVLFGQETYKRADAQDINEADLRSADNPSIMVSGNFYGSGDPKTIYNNLYINNSAYKVWLREQSGYWKTLDTMYGALTHRTNLGYGKVIGDVYVEQLMTPLNMGITYLDLDTVEKIAQWNLTMMLLNGVKDSSGNYVNLHRDGDGIYVSYKGFKVYTTSLRIENIEYEVLDLTNSSDAARFKDLTNMDAATLMGATDGSSDERKYFCLAGVEYSIPVHYEGITRIKNVAEFFWNKEVEGLDGNGRNNDRGRTFTEGQGAIQGGGLTGNGQLAVPGRIVYFVTR